MEVRLLQKGIMARKDNKVKDRIDEVGDLLSKLTSAVRSFTWRNNKLPGCPLSFSLPPSQGRVLLRPPKIRLQPLFVSFLYGFCPTGSSTIHQPRETFT